MVTLVLSEVKLNNNNCIDNYSREWEYKISKTRDSNLKIRINWLYKMSISK